MFVCPEPNVLVPDDVEHLNNVLTQLAGLLNRHDKQSNTGKLATPPNPEIA